MRDVEAVILTGGGSRRMGMDKSKLLVNGETMVDRMLRLLGGIQLPVTVLGPDGVPDSVPGSGPLCALAGFKPMKEYVFVVSCDLPRYDPKVVQLMRDQIGGSDACIPLSEGRLQPLCALYKSSGFELLFDLVRRGEKRISKWTDLLTVRTLEFGENIDIRSVCGVNTPEELAEMSRG